MKLPVQKVSHVIYRFKNGNRHKRTLCGKKVGKLSGQVPNISESITCPVCRSKAPKLGLLYFDALAEIVKDEDRKTFEHFLMAFKKQKDKYENT